MHLVRLCLLALAIGVPGCAKPKSDSMFRATCDAVAINASIARNLRDEATAQYSSVDKAMAMFDAWDHHRITAEEDGAGLYSSAGKRAFGHRDASSALCQSADLIHRSLVKLVEQDKELREQALKMDTAVCPLKSIDGDDRIRDRRQAEWQAKKQADYDLENTLLDTCRRRIPNWEPPVIRGAMLLPNE